MQRNTNVNSQLHHSSYEVTRTNLKNAPFKVLILSKNYSQMNPVDLQITETEVGRDYYIYSTDRITETIMQIEESKFDLICIDYETMGPNALTLLEYSTKVLEVNSETPKIVLTDSFTHITSDQRKNILRFAKKVVSKTAAYFSLENIITCSRTA